MTEEHKQKIREGRERSRLAKLSGKASAERNNEGMEERITNNVVSAVLAALGKNAAPAPVVRGNGQAHMELEQPGARVDPEPYVPPAPVIDPAILKFSELLKGVDATTIDYESCSVLLTSVRELELRLQDSMVKQTRMGGRPVCHICGNPVNPEKPKAMRTVRDSKTGLESTIYFDRELCVLQWDSNRGQPTQRTAVKGPVIELPVGA